MAPDISTTPRRSTTGLRKFLDPEQQRDWIEGEADLIDAEERLESLEQRFKYVARFQKLLRRPQAQDVLEILGVYGQTCIPIPRKTERHYWSVSCLPSTSDKPLVRVNASWMELFTLYADGEGLRARFLVHLSHFTTDHSPAQGDVDELFSSTASRRPKTSVTFFRAARTFSASMCGARPRSANSSRSAASCAPFGLSM